MADAFRRTMVAHFLMFWMKSPVSVRPMDFSGWNERRNARARRVLGGAEARAAGDSADHRVRPDDAGRLRERREPDPRFAWPGSQIPAASLLVVLL